MKFRFFPLMDAAAGGESGAAGGGAEGAAGGPAGSVLGAGAEGATGATGAATGATGVFGAQIVPDFIPEKFRVTKEDGAFDLDASARKMAESYTNLEKARGEPAPKEASEYQIAVPDQFKEAFKADDPEFAEFAKEAHALGLNQKQFDFFMGKFFEIVPAVAQGAADIDSEKATNELSKVWSDPAQMKTEIGAAFQAADRIAKSMGMEFADLEKAGLANNPTFIRMMAKLAPEFREDTQVQGQLLNTPSDIETLRRSEAYTNEKHPQHAATVAKVRAHYDAKFGASQVL